MKKEASSKSTTVETAAGTAKTPSRQSSSSRLRDALIATSSEDNSSSSVDAHGARGARISAPIVGETRRSAEADMMRRLAEEGRAVYEVDPDLVDPSPHRDRVDLSFQDEAFVSLRESILANGQEIPILCYKEDRRYVAIWGHRRLEACRQLGRKVRILVTEQGDLKDRLRRMVRENEDREPVSTFERGLNAARWREEGIFEVHEIANLFKIKQGTVYELIKLASIPENVLVHIGDPRKLTLNVGARLARAVSGASEGAVASALRNAGHVSGDANARAKAIIDTLHSSDGQKDESTAVEKAGLKKVISPRGVPIGSITRSGRQIVLRFDVNLERSAIEEAVQKLAKSWGAK